MSQTMVDVAVIGAGLAGLICARQLQTQGYTVVVLEKSKGLGGRVATRRLQGTWADHGVRCLEAQGYYTTTLIKTLTEAGILHSWHNPMQGQYVAEAGLTAVAKYLAADLEIWRSQRVVAIAPQSHHHWILSLETSGSETTAHLAARAVVVAIPAPQALTLLETLTTLPATALAPLRIVEFTPCLSAIATYSVERLAELEAVPWKATSFTDDPVLSWIGLDHSKRANATFPVIVVQSNAHFAQTYLEARDLTDAGYGLLQQAARNLLNWLNDPVELQVHRWRYGFVQQAEPQSCLVMPTPLPLVCSGDWCGGNTVESALQSGTAAAAHVHEAIAPRI